MQQSPLFVRDEDVRLETVDEGVTRKLLGFNQELMMVRAFFKKGAVGVRHRHPHTQVSFVEKGSFEVEINGSRVVLKAGDSFFIPANMDHGAVALEEGVLIDVFTPARQDFLKSE